MGATAGKKALVKVSGAAVTLTAEPTTGSGTSNRTTYTIIDAAKRVLDPSFAVTVKESTDGVTYTTTAAAYTVNRLTGAITFTGGARPLDTTVQITGKYLPMTAAAEAKSYGYTLSAANLDVSAFGDTFVPRLQGLLDAVGVLGQWRTTDAYMETALTAGVPVVVEFYSNSANAYDLRMWALLNKVDVQSAVAGAVDQSVAFDGAPDADRRVISG